MSELNKIVNQFLHGSEVVPNRALAEEIIDHGALLADFMVNYQLAGGDVAQFGEEDWILVLRSKFKMNEDQIADAMEQLAAWGVVDNQDPR